MDDPLSRPDQVARCAERVRAALHDADQIGLTVVGAYLSQALDCLEREQRPES